MVLEIVIFERVNGCIHKRMHGRRLKYLDSISSPCEGIGELKYRPQKSTFNASDREFLFRTWVTGGIDKTCLRHSSLFSNVLSHTKPKKKTKKKKNVVDENKNDDRGLLSVTLVKGGIEKVCLWIFKQKQ